MAIEKHVVVVAFYMHRATYPLQGVHFGPVDIVELLM